MFVVLMLNWFVRIPQREVDAACLFRKRFLRAVLSRQRASCSSGVQSTIGESLVNSCGRSLNQGL